ncbi:MAG TPA: ATP-binding protein [Solirubrobacteraceae bacterium]|nr:ATP-binding protein [Solirubrobacteraceae bacterium]
MSATAAEVTPIRHAVLDSAAAHGIAAALRADIALAVTEACANVVTHAYRDATAPGPLTVEVYNDRREFVVVVSDRGPGIAPRADSPGIGMGLALIAGVAHRLEISNDDTGARLTMAFAGG